MDSPPFSCGDRGGNEVLSSGTARGDVRQLGNVQSAAALSAFRQTKRAYRRALIATVTVDRDMKAALSAGVSRTPQLYKAPAASGMAITSYPVAQPRFWIIFV